MIKNLFLILFLSALTAKAQSGCTDSSAINYDKNARFNDGSCQYIQSTQTVKKKAQLAAEISESSGLVYSDGFFWTHDDSGNPNAIFKVDTGTGKTLQTIYISNYPNIDWEDITADKEFIYIADCGNNDGSRKDLKILKVAKSSLTNDTDKLISIPASSAIRFSYSDQSNFEPSSNHNFDCEAICSIDTNLYLFTKDRGDFKTRVYKLSKTPGTYILNPLSEYNVNGLITGADYDSVNREVILIGYQSSHKKSFIYYLYDYRNDSFFSGNKRRIEIGNSVNDWQTEGICFGLNKQIYITCETSYVPANLYQSPINSVHKLNVVQPKLNNMINVYPNPSSKEIHIDSDSDFTLTVYDYSGKIVMTTKSNVLTLPNGIYHFHFTARGIDYWEKVSVL